MFDFEVDERGEITVSYSKLKHGDKIDLWELDEAQRVIDKARADMALAEAKRSQGCKQFIQEVLAKTLEFIGEKERFLLNLHPEATELLLIEDEASWNHLRDKSPAGISDWGLGARDGMAMVLGPIARYFRKLADEQNG